MASVIVGALVLVGLCGCEEGESIRGAAVSGEAEYGKASYYAGEWVGKLTANGETYDAETYTAAHKELDFGTWVRVTRLSSGKAVKVRINNRGPFVEGRIIDLSLRAARDLDMLEDGVVDVKVEILDP
ncbi:MAG: septal ring lytic transglycosylase RlpA family protein [Verrucomicrobiota bacterium]